MVWAGEGTEGGCSCFGGWERACTGKWQKRCMKNLLSRINCYPHTRICNEIRKIHKYSISRREEKVYKK
jgi:hypothetical protein